MKNILIIIPCFLAFSCNTIYGIKKNTSVNEQNIQQISSYYGIENSYIINKNYFEKIEPIQDSLMRKHHVQPLQALYFNNTGQNIASLFNCNASGVVNLNWNKAGDLSIFPPVTTNVLDTISLSRVLEFSNLTEKVKMTNNDFIVVIFWNAFMGRQTKKFLTAVRKNVDLNKNSTVRIIYVNDDNLYYE